MNSILPPQNVFQNISKRKLYNPTLSSNWTQDVQIGCALSTINQIARQTFHLHLMILCAIFCKNKTLYNKYIRDRKYIMRLFLDISIWIVYFFSEKPLITFIQIMHKNTCFCNIFKKIWLSQISHIGTTSTTVYPKRYFFGWEKL